MFARTCRRDGQVSLITVFAVFTLVLLVAGVLNVTRVTATKMEQQNAADAAAHAAGVEMARGLNAVTTLNHLIVELNATSAVIMGLGGLPLEDYLRDGKKRVNLPVEEAQVALAAARAFDGGTAPRGVNAAEHESPSKSGGAIGDSRKKLLPILTAAYWVHAAGGVLLDLGIPFGGALVVAAVVIELAVELEWRVLDTLEVLAEKTLLPLKWLINHGTPEDPEAEWGIIPRLYKRCVRVVEETPHRAEEAAERVAKEYGTVGSLFPNTRGEEYKLELPVEKERFARESEGHRKSHMVRGMTPWVQYWRRPILRYGRLVLPLSGFSRHYHTHTNEFTLNMAWWQWEENRTRLFRLKDLEVTGDDKGGERWTTEEGSDRANELFGVVGFAHKPPPVVIGFPIFRQSQPDGIAAHAQVLIYNANPQNRPRRAKWQPVVGWDTLAWDNLVPEFEYGEDFDREMRRDRIDQPRVKPNWQTKLVPVAVERLTHAVGTQGPELNRILDRLMTDRPLVNTH